MAATWPPGCCGPGDPGALGAVTGTLLVPLGPGAWGGGTVEQPSRSAVAMQRGGLGWCLASSSILAPAGVGAWPQHGEQPQCDRVLLRGRKGLHPPGFFPLPKPSPGSSSHRTQPLAERSGFQNGAAVSHHLAVAGPRRTPEQRSWAVHAAAACRQREEASVQLCGQAVSILPAPELQQLPGSLPSGRLPSARPALLRAASPLQV